MSKTFCCFLFHTFLFVSLRCSAQETELIQEKIDSLKQIKEELDTQSKQLGIEISNLTNRKLVLERAAIMAKGTPIYCRVETNVYAGRGTWTDLIGTIPKGTTIMAYDFKSNYYFVAFDTLNGYVMGMNVETLDVRNEKLEKERKDNLRQQQVSQERLEQREARKTAVVSKYGQINGGKIFSGKVWLGMTKEMAEDSWGKPKDVNRTVGSWGVKEQWVYSDAYLYFDNGILNSWQD